MTRDRVDLAACILKPGVAAATGSQVTPATDATYVSIATVTVPFAATAVTPAMIAAVTSTQFLGFARIGTGGGGVTSVTASGNLASSGGVTPNITIAASPVFAGGTVTAQTFGIRYTGFGDAQITADTAGGVNFIVAPAAPANGFQFFANGAGALNNLFQINTTGVIAFAPLLASVNTVALGHVPPTYTATGADAGTTVHMVVGTVTLSAATSIAITFTGAAVFTSASSFTCSADGVNANQAFWFNQANGTSTSLNTAVSVTGTIPYSCVGT